MGALIPREGAQGDDGKAGLGDDGKEMRDWRMALHGPCRVVGCVYSGVVW